MGKSDYNDLSSMMHYYEQYCGFLSRGLPLYSESTTCTLPSFGGEDTHAHCLSEQIAFDIEQVCVGMLGHVTGHQRGRNIARYVRD